MAENKETVILEFEVDTKDAVVSIESLTKANKALREERKNVNLQTEEGIARVKEINKAIDSNNGTIKANSDALSKQRLNIGNYASAIDRLIPGFDGLSQAVSGSSTFIEGASQSIGRMSLASKLLLGPIGLIIAGISLLVSWLTRTEAGGDLLAKTIDQLQAILNVVLDRITAVGGALAKLFTGDIIGAWEDAKTAISGIGDEMAREVRIAGELADALDELEDRERNQKVALSESTLEIKRLIIESKNRNLTEAEKIKLLEQANDLEVKNNIITKQIALDKLNAATKQIELDFSQFNITKKKTESELEYAQRIVADANLTGAARDKVADAIIALNDVEGQSLVIQEKIANQIDAQNQKQKEKIEKLKELEEKEYEKFKKDIERNELAHQSNDELYQNTLDKLAKIDEKEKEVSDNKAIYAANDTIEKQIQLDNQVRANKEASDKVIKIQEEENQKRLDLITANVNDVINLINQLASGIINTKLRQYQNEERHLNATIAKQKTALNASFNSELTAIKKKYDDGLISKEEYDKQVLLLNQNFQAQEKKADIENAKALNEIKRKEFETDKKNKIAAAIADAARAVLGVVAATFGGPVIKAAAAALQVAFNAIQIRQIKEQEFVPTTFRVGGYTGDGNPDDIAGEVHKREFVMPASVVDKYGRDYFQSYLDGSTVANNSTASVNVQSQIKNPIYLDYTEFRRFAEKVQVKESIITSQ